MCTEHCISRRIKIKLYATLLELPEQAKLENVTSPNQDSKQRSSGYLVDVLPLRHYSPLVLRGANMPSHLTGVRFQQYVLLLVLVVLNVHSAVYFYFIILFLQTSSFCTD